VKVRQPLRMFEIRGKNVNVDALKQYNEVFVEELNVKDVVFNSNHYYDEDPDGEFIGQIELELNEELLQEGMSREVIRHVQAARKNAGLNVDDRIRLSLSTSDERLSQAIAAHQTAIAAETLAIDT